jgi:hypothetical protein
MISDARNGHVSPGIYTEEKDVTYSVKSLGITSLGLVGETLYGPAFQNVEIKNWTEFVDYFGGTSPEKFKGGLPKYELPYIAKSYLEESNRLNVVRVLGLSGYHAGKCWVVKDTEGNPIVVLRSKMKYGIPSSAETYEYCNKPVETPTEIVSSITVGEYKESVYDADCIETSKSGEPISGETYFSLTINCKSGYGFNDEYKYNVTLEPNHPNYIYNVLSNRPDTGTTPVYIEAVFENNIKTSVSSGTLTAISKEVTIDNKSIEMYDDYLEGYRAAQTPWIVSDASVSSTGEGDNSTVEAKVRKLFRFITISDGNAANYQIKVSIQNIKPEDGVFDVVVRDFNDSDLQPMVLERFSKCNLVEGDSNYIAYKIGTSDGGYVSKSKYILVEMSDSEDLRNAVPAGFLGYPMPDYGSSASPINMTYNTLFNPEIKAKKQYFGISDLTGVDIDMLSYKGRLFYNNKDYMRNGFHMDAAVSKADSVYVDGVTGYSFTTVSDKKVSDAVSIPRLINANYIKGTIYNDVNLRKFTLCFFGGFDGWDVNRESRTNTDDFKATKYKTETTGATVFERWKPTDNMNMPLNLPNTAITSDYYAYLAGYRVFANPQDIDINIFATPGIDWYNNALLTEEAIDMIEDAEDGRGGDALYIMSSPHGVDVDELTSLFEETDINSSYACTYAPWVMYYDSSNKRYLDLPVTKDVVRNMAATDNNSYPWFAPAGMERGNVNCVRAEYKTTLANEDDLYENRINPVKSFAQDGVKIWGNKTAYTVESPLNRINVRRLMIRVKKLVTNAAKNLIFTQYDDTLEKQFRGLIDPILADVKSNRGISDYRIITEVTPETKDQHILPAKILIKPTPALEYISISFVVYPESVSFDEN